MASFKRQALFWSFAVWLHLSRKKRAYLAGSLAAFLLGALVWNGLGRPASLFPTNTVLTIPEGSSLNQAADILYEHHAIASRGLFTFLLRVSGKGTNVQAGDYLFSKPVGLWELTRRLVHGEFGFLPVTITFVEGTTTREMGLLLFEKLGIDAKTFQTRAREYEGFLFPETYKFFPSAGIEEVLTLLARTFAEKTAEARQASFSSGHSFRDIVIMASLLEKEARTVEDRKILSGILWRRIELGMPLQVDAVFGYINGRATYHPTLADLEVDSPYNTYTHTGLPPGPINNPGLDAIVAAQTPTASLYLYYLTGNDGKMHYARTFSEHIENRKKYLD